MAWRNWSVILLLILANYVVFSILATLVFPVPPQTPPTHIARPTFTPGTPPLQAVGTLTYDFLTPSATPTPTGIPPTATATPRSTVIPTRSP
jgi:hypothetical protein